MSASEKLRALDVKPELISLSAARLFNALPQIVAVVEAAEKLEYGGRSRAFDQVLAPLRVALAALDEQLQGLSSATEPEAPTPQ